jgi:hypothetical protein
MRDETETIKLVTAQDVETVAEILHFLSLEPVSLCRGEAFLSGTGSLGLKAVLISAVFPLIGQKFHLNAAINFSWDIADGIAMQAFNRGAAFG